LNFEIATAGKSALNFIESYSEGETIGETVKVFENTVYLKTRNDDLICLTSKDVKAPMNLNLNTPVDFLKLDCISKKAIRTPTGNLFLKKRFSNERWSARQSFVLFG